MDQARCGGAGAIRGMDRRRQTAACRFSGRQARQSSKRSCTRDVTGVERAIKMHPVAVCVLCLCSGPALGADHNQPKSYRRQQVAQLKPSNAAADAKNALSRGDKRLLAVYGYALELPGIDGDLAKMRAIYGLRLLRTAAARRGNKDEQERAFQKSARLYAAAYNRVIIAGTRPARSSLRQPKEGMERRPKNAGSRSGGSGSGLV